MSLVAAEWSTSSVSDRAFLVLQRLRVERTGYAQINTIIFTLETLMIHRKHLAVFLFLPACFSSPSHAETVLNKSFQGKYTAVARSCVHKQCDDQSESITGSFFIGAENARVYSGTNKGLVLPFGQRHLSNKGMSVWIVPTSAGFDESYAKDGFTITHHYVMNRDRTCSVSVSVAKAPADVRTTYRTAIESCTVADGNVFAQ